MIFWENIDKRDELKIEKAAGHVFHKEANKSLEFYVGSQSNCMLLVVLLIRGDVIYQLWGHCDPGHAQKQGPAGG